MSQVEVESLADPTAGDVGLRRRTPVERAALLAEERRRLAEDGLSSPVLDVVERVLESLDRDTLDETVAWVMRVVDGWCRDHRNALFEVPVRDMQRLVVEAAVGYLLGHGLLRVPAAGELAGFPGDWREAVPAHLLPDVGAAVERCRAARAGQADGRAPGWVGLSLNPPRSPHLADRQDGGLGCL